MNEQKLTKYLASYKEWLTKNPSVANEAKQEDSTIIQDVMLSQHITNLESRILQYQHSNIFHPYGPWRCGAISTIRLIIS